MTIPPLMEDLGVDDDDGEFFIDPHEEEEYDI